VLDDASGDLRVLRGDCAVSCYLGYNGAADRPADDVVVSTLRTLAAAILSRR
jgi:hypothetical protein